MFLPLVQVTFPLLEVPEAIVGLIAGHMDTCDSLCLWMSGNKRVQSSLEAHMKHVSAILPAGYWAVPWPLLGRFKSMQTLIMGFPRFGIRWMFAETSAFEPFNRLLELNLQNPSLVALVPNIHLSFPNLTHLTLFIATSADLRAKASWEMPPSLQSLVVETPNARKKDSGPALCVFDVPWLCCLPDSVHTLRIALYLDLALINQHQPNQTFRWPLQLSHLSIGFKRDWDLLAETQITPSEPLPTSIAEESTSSHSNAPLQSAAEYAKAMRDAKKAQKEAQDESLSQNPKTSGPLFPPLATLLTAEPSAESTMKLLHATPISYSKPYALFPSGLETLEIDFANEYGTPPEPSSLPPRIRSIAGRGSSSWFFSRDQIAKYCKARPLLKTCLWSKHESEDLMGESVAISTLQALKNTPASAEHMSVVLSEAGELNAEAWSKNVPQSVTMLKLEHRPRMNDSERAAPSIRITALPPKLRSIRLILKDPAYVKFPESVTSVEVCGARLMGKAALPKSLTSYSSAYGSGDLTVLPTCLTRLTISVGTGMFAESVFHPRHLPPSLRHLSVSTITLMERSIHILKWWSCMPLDIALETLSIEYSEPWRATDSQPYPSEKTTFLPVIPPSLVSLSIVTYEIPIEVSTHILKSITSQLCHLKLDVYASQIRSSPKVPDSLTEKLPPFLESLSGSVFSTEALEGWKRKYAQRNGIAYKPS